MESCISLSKMVYAHAGIQSYHSLWTRSRQDVDRSLASSNVNNTFMPSAPELRHKASTIPQSGYYRKDSNKKKWSITIMQKWNGPFHRCNGAAARYHRQWTKTGLTPGFTSTLLFNTHRTFKHIHDATCNTQKTHVMRKPVRGHGTNKDNVKTLTLRLRWLLGAGGCGRTRREVRKNICAVWG